MSAEAKLAAARRWCSGGQPGPWWQPVQLAPRLMVAYDDVQQRSAEAPSRVNTVCCGRRRGALQQMRAWLEERLPRAVSWRSGNARRNCARRWSVRGVPQSRGPVRESAGGVAIMLRRVDCRPRALTVRRCAPFGMSAAAVCCAGISCGCCWSWSALHWAVLAAWGSIGLVSVLGDWFGGSLPAPGAATSTAGLRVRPEHGAGLCCPTLPRVGRCRHCGLRREMDAPGPCRPAVWVAAGGRFRPDGLAGTGSAPGWRHGPGGGACR